MKKYITILLTLFITISITIAKDNHIYGEGFGVGLLGSLNYERLINSRVAARIGISPYSGTVSSQLKDENGNLMGSVGEFKFSITQIIAGASYLRGNKWILELGGGINYWIVSGIASFGDFKSDKADASLLNFYGLGGVRYQKPDGGITFRAGLSYMKAKTVGIMLPYLSLGYAF